MTTTTFKPPPPGVMSWAQLLTIVGFAGALAAQWTAVASRQAGVEATVSALQNTMNSMEARSREAETHSRESDAELRAAVRIIDGKITQLLMQGYRPPVPTTR